MKTLLLSRIKKWTLFALIGCFAYFAGYIVGHKTTKPSEAPSIPSLQAPPEKE